MDMPPADIDSLFGPSGGGTAALSNTICIADPHAEFASVTSNAVVQLQEFGEIARLDTSLATVLSCVLVTFFDIRSTQKAFASLAGRCDFFPSADHDFRVVRVNIAAAAKVGVVGGFTQFGEVANITMQQGDAIVEFCDMRAALRCCAMTGGAASPCSPKSQVPPLGQAWGQYAGVGGSAGGLATLAGQGGLAAHVVTAAAAAMQPGLAGGEKGDASAIPVAAAAPAGAAGAAMAVTPKGQVPPGLARQLAKDGQINDDSHFIPTGVENSLGAGDAKFGGQERSPMRTPTRTKIPNKDFSKYDISPEKIVRGEDPRTTVMVRNLLGPRARKDFLRFLEKCGLQDRYTFFYMPCKEHRDVRAGFAFVNLISAGDVQKLYAALKTSAWQDMKRGDPQCKPLAMSYARFQGHDELVAHFSSSVVLHEQDPEKRPIFFPAGAGRARGGRKGDRGEDIASSPPCSASSQGSPPKVPTGSPSSLGSPLADDTELHTALARGVQEITAILSSDRQVCAGKAMDAPVYLPVPGLPGGDLPGDCTHVHPASIGG